MPLGVLLRRTRIDGLIILAPLCRHIGTDHTERSMNLTQLLLNGDAEIKTLAVLDVIVDGRHERTARKSTFQIRGECGQVLNNIAGHIRIEEGEVSANQLVEE